MRVLKYIAAVVALLAGAVALFMALWPDFGGRVTGERLLRAKASPHHNGENFVNTIPQAENDLAQLKEIVTRQFGGTEIRTPPSAIPVVAIAEGFFDAPPRAGLRAIWFGHATVYLEIDGVRMMVDPMLSERASPVGIAGPKRFHPPPAALEDLHNIDGVVISHDHYDHMDMATIQSLARHGTHFFVPLGAGAHLDRWGVPADQYSEMEWWEHLDFKGLKITSTPARHYSGRGVLNQKETFWSSWVIAGPDHKVFYSGDTGYSPHFAEIGEKLGPFDLDIMKIGAYGPGPSWTDIHMPAEDAIAAHRELRAARLLPVHWATFNLAFHDWDEPIRRAVKAAHDADVEMVTPRIGEVVTAGHDFASANWWEEVRQAGGPR